MKRLQTLTWLAALAFVRGSLAQTAQSPSTPVRVILTLGHSYGYSAPLLTPADLKVTEQWSTRKVTSLIPLRGELSAMELYILADNCSDCALASKFTELRRFLVSQPGTTRIGVAYIRDGQLEVVEKPTGDRAAVVRALAAPAAGNGSSPFRALTKLIAGWPEGAARRAVVLISGGMDSPALNAPADQSAEAAIEAAQRAGVAVYAIYQPAGGYLNDGQLGLRSGQTELAHVALETGGEAYFLGLAPLPSLAPFLTDLADHFANQYRLEFLVNGSDAPGTLQPIMIETPLAGVEVMAPYRVLIPAPAS